ncbi:MAG: 4-hydroxy-tetrahydrodipicolinate reductase [Acidobacteria bacterium]|nr:4-hydroxy-tetrahydrodipicolinate reductase [Acidobacteriota bacterium]
MMRLLVVGRGRMGTLVETLAPSYGFEVVKAIDEDANAGAAGLTAEVCRSVDVAIEFTVPAAAPANLAALAAHGVDAVVGTTGWHERVPELRQVVADAGIGVVVSANFSVGVALFERLVERAGALMAGHAMYGAWIHELHHAAKLDAPSGTARLLADALSRSGYTARVDIASTRAGAIPGTHTVGFDGPADTITLTHAVRDRATFAHGALTAARWVAGRRGWFTMRDVVALE